MIELKPREEKTATFTVGEAHTAAAFAERPDESFPAVLSTPHLIGAMERTCAEIMTPHLTTGQMSVGAAIDIQHKAPTGVGGQYHCHAVFLEKSGPLYWFEVSAADAAGTIGKGRIARAIVDEATILDRAAKSLEQASN